MTWQQFIILFIVYLICAAPFVRIMLKWDKNNDFRENETKINLMLRFFFSPASFSSHSCFGC